MSSHERSFQDTDRHGHAVDRTPRRHHHKTSTDRQHGWHHRLTKTGVSCSVEGRSGSNLADTVSISATILYPTLGTPRHYGIEEIQFQFRLHHHHHYHHHHHRPDSLTQQRDSLAQCRRPSQVQSRQHHLQLTPVATDIVSTDSTTSWRRHNAAAYLTRSP